MGNKLHKFSTFATALALLANSPQASAEICKVVNGAMKAAAAGVATQSALASVPVTAVLHSSGGYILTGASGYLANTLGVVGTAWAVATAPVTIVAVGTVAATGLGAVAVCRYLRSEKPSVAEGTD